MQNDYQRGGQCLLYLTAHKDSKYGYAKNGIVWGEKLPIQILIYANIHDSWISDGSVTAPAKI